MALEAVKQNLIVRSQLIPLDGMCLVLPNTSIAEVITLQTFEDAMHEEDMPAWVLGMFHWRGLSVPLLSFEAAIGHAASPTSKRSRIIVMNATSNHQVLPFYGLVAQGIPRLMALDNEAIIDAPEQEETPFVLRHTLIDGNPAFIPDQNAIEQELQRLNLQVREA